MGSTALSQMTFRVAQYLEHSNNYKKTKLIIGSLFYDVNNMYKKILDRVIVFLVFSSVFILIYEVKNPVPDWIDYYDFYFVSFVFFIEYLLRLWIINDTHLMIMEEYRIAKYLGRPFNPWIPFKKSLKEKFQYMITPAAIIDLLAVFPAYSPLRVLRLFVLFRVLKLLRYSKNIKQIIEVLSSKKFELFTLLFLLIFVDFTSGIAIYVLEERINPNINSLFDALYWSLVTISTVGYGDISPVTDAGRIVSMIIIVSGIGMISFATSVIVSAFSEKLSELKETRIIEQIKKSQNFLIICGYGQLTKTFLQQERGIEHNYIILEIDKHRVEEAISDGFNAIKADASRDEVLRKFINRNAKITILSLTNNDIENIYITLNAKIINPNIQVIARANDAKLYKKFQRAGADHILTPNTVANTMLITAINQPTIYRAIHAVLTGKNIVHMDEIILIENNKLIGKRVGDINFKKFKLLLVGIQRGIDTPFIFNPTDDMVFCQNDVALMIGKKESHSYFKEMYQDPL